MLSIALFKVSAQSNTFPDEIIKATKSGDSRVLANYFNDKVEIIQPGNSGVYSKAQAEQVLKTFFINNPVVDFKILHQGERDNSSFAIGKYSSRGENFRIYFLSKETSGSTLIHQIRIEKQDE